MYGREYLEFIENRKAAKILDDAFGQAKAEVIELYGEEVWERIAAHKTLGCDFCMRRNRENMEIQNSLMRQQQAAFPQILGSPLPGNFGILESIGLGRLLR